MYIGIQQILDEDGIRVYLLLKSYFSERQLKIKHGKAINSSGGFLFPCYNCYYFRCTNHFRKIGIFPENVVVMFKSQVLEFLL